MLRIAFLGCGFITQVNSRHLKALRGIIEPSYASRDAAKAAAFSARYGGACSYGEYAAAIADPKVDALVIAVPPSLHLELTIQALAAGKHVLVEKPAFPNMEGYRAALDARNRARRVVLIGENDVRLEVTLPWLLHKFGQAIQKTIAGKGQILLEKK